MVGIKLFIKLCIEGRNMIDSETTKKILTDLNKSLSITEISKKYKVHRNTVRNIKIRYPDKSDNATPSKLILEKTKTINAEYRNIIKIFCHMHLNCYIYENRPIEWAKYLCEKLNVEYDDLKNYSPEKIKVVNSNSDNNKRRTYLATIRRIRALTYVYKNYEEVYQLFKAENFFGKSAISPTSFYNCAKEYWIDVNFEATLGEIIDNSK